MDQPWKTLEKVNSLSLNPGDRLLLEGGQHFTGMVSLSEKDSGRPGKPVTISSYGTGMATITNASGPAIKVSVCRNLIISNLILVGPGRTVLNGAAGMSLVWLRDSVIHHVEASGFQKGGFYLNKCVDVRLTDLHAHDNGYAGIHTEGDSERLYIARCRAINNPGDPAEKNNHSGSGIFVSFTKNSLVERCEAAENGWDMPCLTMGPVGIWTAFVDNVTVQHCISHHNKTRPGSWDGAASISMAEPTTRSTSTIIPTKTMAPVSCSAPSRRSPTATTRCATTSARMMA
jgi:hypothetical protein